MLELSVLYQKFYPKLVYLLLSSRGSLLDLQIRKLFSYINQHPNSEPPFFTCFFKWESAKSTVSFFFMYIYTTSNNLFTKNDKFVLLATNNSLCFGRC